MASALFFVLTLIGIVFAGLVYLLHKANRQPQPPVSVDPADRWANNRFISPHALENLQRRREMSAARTEASSGKHAVRPSGRTRSTGIDRSALKTECLALLEAAALAHPAGHGKSFARYILRSQNGERVELMFEKGEKVGANLWLSSNHAGELLNRGLQCRHYPAAAMNVGDSDGKRPTHGRHAALKSMRDLAYADLVRFTIDRVAQLELLLSRLAER
ncbi:MAG TPA: hypothetical protein PKY73_05810 [Hyphomonas sp.]|nr:hypothetical protein [Hyphomonas sp.]